MASSGGSPLVGRRAHYVVAAIVVVAAVVVAGVAYYLDLTKYPSEDTPLVLQSWGISWIREQEGTYSSSAPPFSDLELWWTEFPSTYSYGTPPLNTTTSLRNTADFELPSSLTVLFETYECGWHSDNTVDGVRIFGVYGVFITDVNENGLFDYGDAVSLFHGVYENGTLAQEGFSSNVEYGVTLGSCGHWGVGVEFRFAIHHEKLYAWKSD